MNATPNHQGLTPIETGRRGLMLILSSPSGAGKTTLTRMLLQDKSIDLTLVDDFRDQVNNSSTLFGNDIVETTLTVLITITDADGNYADCEVGGENTGFFSSDCG